MNIFILNAIYFYLYVGKTYLKCELIERKIVHKYSRLDAIAKS